MIIWAAKMIGQNMKTRPNRSLMHVRNNISPRFSPSGSRGDKVVAAETPANSGCAMSVMTVIAKNNVSNNLSRGMGSNPCNFFISDKKVVVAAMTLMAAMALQ